MPGSTRQRTKRQPARSAKAKTCRQATMRPLTDEEVILRNGADDMLKKRLGFVSLGFFKSGLSGPRNYPAQAAESRPSTCRRLAGRSVQQPRVPGPVSALPQPTRGLQSRAGRYTRQDTGVHTAVAPVTEASHSTSQLLPALHSSGLLCTHRCSSAIYLLRQLHQAQRRGPLFRLQLGK